MLIADSHVGFLEAVLGYSYYVYKFSRKPAALRPRLGVGHAVAAPAIGRAARRGELPAGADAELAGLAHEVIEAHVLRRVADGSALSREFARHVVDELVIPVLTAHQKGNGHVTGTAGQADG